MAISMNQFPFNPNGRDGLSDFTHGQPKHQPPWQDDSLPDEPVIDPQIKEQAAYTEQQLKRLFLILLGLGLGLGVICSIGLILLLNYLGLTNHPNESDSSSIEVLCRDNCCIFITSSQD
jgi:hypothetical protein